MDIQLIIDTYPLKSGMDFHKYWKELLKRYKGTNGDIRDVKTPVFDLLSKLDYYRSEQGLIEYCIDRTQEIKGAKRHNDIDLESILQQKRGLKNKQHRILIASDTHGIFLDLGVRDCLLRILKQHHFDEVILNGDLTDMPYLSDHKSRMKLNEKAISRDYSETKEIEYTTEQLFKALKNTVSQETKIIARLGNHDERITDPKRLDRDQLLRLQNLQINFQTIDYSKMLKLDEVGIEYDPTPVRSYFNIYDIVHGLSLRDTAAKQNLTEYDNSGSSGHTHRLGSISLTKKNRHLMWNESGCMRNIKAIEYMPTAKTPNWANGFCETVFDLNDEPIVFSKNHLIQNNRCAFNGYVY